MIIIVETEDGQKEKPTTPSIKPNKRPISASINAKPECIVTTIGDDDIPIELTLCRVISIILSILVVICFISLYLIKN